MADRIIHKNDVGVVLVATFLDENGTAIDVSAQTTMELFVKKPDDTTATLTPAVFTTDGTDGKIQFVSLAGTLDQAGMWWIQGHVITASLNITSVRYSIIVQDRIV